jgi:hypothetical protein
VWVVTRTTVRDRRDETAFSSPPGDAADASRHSSGCLDRPDLPQVWNVDPQADAKMFGPPLHEIQWWAANYEPREPLVSGAARADAFAAAVQNNRCTLVTQTNYLARTESGILSSRLGFSESGVLDVRCPRTDSWLNHV